MTVLADFSEILGNQGQNVGVAQGAAAISLPSFNTGGVRTNDSALLFFLASNLQGSAAIFINNRQVGAVFPTGPAGAASTQMADIPAGVLRTQGVNTIELKNVTDTFNIRNVYCFYHQDS